MSPAQRRRPASVIERLLAEPHRFEFFQAVRLLEQWFVREEQLGTAVVLSQRIQFRNTLSLSFPPSEVAEFKIVRAPGAAIDEAVQIPHAPESQAPCRPADVTGGSSHDGGLPAADQRDLDSRRIAHIEMTPAFMGLLGAGGALPIFYTELFAQREFNQRDPAARAFMDIFLHRAVVLFYQAWRKHRLAIQFESDRRNRFLPLVLSVAGFGHKALRNRLRADEGGVADDTLAYFAGALQQRPVSSATIQRVLSRYFAVPVKLEQFIGRWFSLPKGNQTQLGVGNASLGQGAVASERVWQRDLRMRLTIGPMPRDKFRRFLPGSSAELALKELLTLFTGVALEYEVRLQLQAADVQPARLSEKEGPLLGWDSFLTSQRSHVDRTDAGYDIHAIA
jgi:type VI secretion system protein ImpH